MSAACYRRSSRRRWISGNILRIFYIMIELNKQWVAYLAVPIVAALIGWITNYIAVKMIFHPRYPIRFLGLTIHGVIPKRQKELAVSLGETIEEKLISHRDVQAVLQSAEVHARVLALIEEQIDLFFKTKLSSNPLIGMFLQGDFVGQIKRLLIEQLTESLPEFIDGMMKTVEDRLDFKEIVRRKVEEFHVETLEAIVYDIASRELKTIELLGGVLGFAVGLIQIAIMIWAR